MQNEFLTTGPRRHKQYILMTCVIRTIASMRQDEAIASSWFWLFFYFCFLKKRLIEKIIPRKNWICLQSISEPLDLKIFLNKKFNETVVLGLRLVPLHPHDGCKWIHCHDETFEILDIYETSPSHSNGFYILGNSFTFYP